MAYTVHISPSETTDTQYANDVLGHALRSVRIGRALGINQSAEPEISRSLGDLLGSTAFVVHGPSEYGGAIKGDALLGYVEYIAGPELARLQQSSAEAQQHAQQEFLRRHGIAEHEINNEICAHVPLECVALWRAFKDHAIIAPTSGSFGLAAYETIQHLRDATLTIGNHTLHVLQAEKGEGKARAWIPAPQLAIMTPEKTHVIEQIAGKLDLPVNRWTERTTRDHFAMLDALAHGDYFCPTNPKNMQEVADILTQVLQNTANGAPIFTHDDNLAQLETLHTRLAAHDAQTCAALEHMGVTLEADGTLRVHHPISAGRFGLIMPRLQHLEDVLADGDIKTTTTYNQPGIGATFAAAADIDGILRSVAKGDIALSPENTALLRDYFPRVYKAVHQHALPELTMAVAPDVCNTTLAAELGLQVPAIAHRHNPENGVGSITAGMEALDAVRRHQATGNARIAESCTPATKPWIAVAQVLLYLHEIDQNGAQGQFPESAGSVSLASALRQRYLAGELTVEELAYSLRKQGVTKETFEHILALRFPHQQTPWQELEKEAQTHGAEEVAFLNHFQHALDQDPASLRQTLPKREHAYDHAVAIYNTGSNGTQHIHQAIYDTIAQERTRVEQADPARKKKIIVVGGGLIGMQSAKQLADAGYDVTLLDAGRVGGGTSAGHPGMWSFYSARGIELADVERDIDQDGFKGERLVLPGTGIAEQWKAQVPTDPARRSAILRARVQLAHLGMQYQQRQRETDPGLRASEFNLDEHGAARYYYSAASADADTEKLDGLLKTVGYQTAEHLAGLLDIPGVTHQTTFPGGKFNIPAYCAAQSAHLQSHGARILENTPVTDMIMENNRCCGVRTADGQKIRADAVVISTGANRDLLQKANPEIARAIVPLTGASANCVLSDAQAKRLEHLPSAFQVWCPESIPGRETLINAAVLERADGSKELRVGGMMLAGTLKPGTLYEPAAGTMKSWVKKLVPDMPDEQIAIWHGERSTTPDLMPIVGQDTQVPGLFYNIGQNSSGTSLSAGSALALTQEMDKFLGTTEKHLPHQLRKTPLDAIAPYLHPSRFSQEIAHPTENTDDRNPRNPSRSTRSL